MAQFLNKSITESEYAYLYSVRKTYEPSSIHSIQKTVCKKYPDDLYFFQRDSGRKSQTLFLGP